MSFPRTHDTLPSFRPLTTRAFVSWIVAVGTVLAAARPATAQQVTATLSPQIVSQGQLAEYSIAYEGPQTNPDGVPDLTDVPGLDIQGPQSQQSLTLNNNVASYRFEAIWQISAAQPGKYTLPAQVISFGGQAYTTKELVLEVREGAAPSASFDPVLRMRIDKTDLYIGEVTPITITALFHRRTQLRNYGHPKLPRENFVVKRFPPPGPAPMVELNGERYQPIEFRSSLSALREGELTVGPATLDDVLVDFPPDSAGEAGRRSAQGIPPSFFQRMNTRQLSLTSEAITVRIKPLPTEGRPPDFSGAVGRFTAMSRLGQSSAEVQVGDPLSIDLIVTGEGNFDSLAAPVPAVTEGWKFYPSKVVQENRGFGLEPGSQSWNQVLVPQQPTQEVPAFVLSFFDPATASYQTVRTAPIPILVRPGEARPDPRSGEAPTKDFSLIDASIPEEQLSDILTLRPATEKWVPLTPSATNDAVFWGVQAAPAALFLAFLAVGIQRRQREHRESERRAREGRPRLPSEIRGDLRRPNLTRREFYSLAREFVHASSFHAGQPARASGLNGELDAVLARQTLYSYAGPNPEATTPIPAPEQKEILSTLDKLAR